MNNHQLVECFSDEEWDTFINSSPQCNAFSLSAFINALHVEYSRYLFTIDSKIAASVLVLKPCDSSFSAPHPYTLYQGLSYSEKRFKEPSQTSYNLRITQSLLHYLNKLHPCHSLCLHPSIIDMRAFQWYNYNDQLNNRYSIDLSYTGIISLRNHKSFQHYLASIRSSRRQDYKKCVKYGIILSREILLSDFIRLYERTFARQTVHLTTSTVEYVRNLVEYLLNSGIAKMLSAIDQKGYVCSSVVIISDSFSDYYLFGSTDPEFRSYGVNTFLLLESIKDSFNSGKSYFDMVGINSPYRGDFKTSFNAIPTPFFSPSISNSF